MIVKGPSLNDPAVLAIQSAFAIAGYNVQYQPGGEDLMNRSLWLEF